MKFSATASILLLCCLAAAPQFSHCQMQCNARSSLKRQVIRNPTQLPQSTCRYTIEPWSQFACQVRIDFEQFELAQPASNESTQVYECIDYFKVGEHKLCGNNAGQHLYVAFKKSLQLEFVLNTRWPKSAWHLVLTQLDCPRSNTQRNSISAIGSSIGLPGFGLRTIFTNPMRPILDTIAMPHVADFEVLAPLGCDQYYRTTTGNIRSWNYGQGGVYMPNMKYTICIKQTGGSEKIEYSFTSFAMSGSRYSGSGYDFDCHPTVHTPGHAEDYLLIPTSLFVNNAALQPTYYCGNMLNGVTVLAHEPFIIYFSSDDLSDATETGFELTYKI